MFLLVACSPDASLSRLDKPIGITVTKNVVSYESVANATSYILNISGTNVTTTQTSYTIEEEGTFNVRIKAVGSGYLDSLFSDQVTVTVGFLNTPSNIRVNDEGKILFDGDNRASHYIIRLNATDYSTLEYPNLKVNPGIHMIQVKAVSPTLVDSDFSEVKTINFGMLNYATNISITNGVLTYTKDARAYYHFININGTIYDTRTDIIPFFGVGEYVISIDSRRDGYIPSGYTTPLTFIITENDIIQTTHNFQYSLFSEFDLLLFNYGSKSLNGFELNRVSRDQKEVYETIDPENLYILENAIYLSSEYLKTLEERTKVVYYKLRTNLGEHFIAIEITTDQKPYVYSDKNVKTDYHNDVVFLFDVQGSEFVSISGDDITEADYIFKDGILTIKNEFIVKFFQENLDKDSIILTYRFKGTTVTNGKETPINYLGFISIKR